MYIACWLKLIIFHPLIHSTNTDIASTVENFLSSLQDLGSFPAALQVFGNAGVNYWQVLSSL